MRKHQGVRRTIDSVLQEYFWPDLRRDVRHFVITCGTCRHNVQKRKSGSWAPPGGMPNCRAQDKDVPDPEAFKSKTPSRMSNGTVAKSTFQRPGCEPARSTSLKDLNAARNPSFRGAGEEGGKTVPAEPKALPPQGPRPDRKRHRRRGDETIVCSRIGVNKSEDHPLKSPSHYKTTNGVTQKKPLTRWSSWSHSLPD